MMPTPVFPDRGPAGPYHVRAFLNAGDAAASVVINPITNVPMAAATIAAAAGPVDFCTLMLVRVISNTPYRTGATLFRNAPKIPAMPAAANARMNSQVAALRSLLSFAICVP